jgi:hypothetical protein
MQQGMEDRAAVWTYARPLGEHDMTIHCPNTHQPCLQSLDPQTECMGSEQSQSSTSHPPHPHSQYIHHVPLLCPQEQRGVMRALLALAWLRLAPTTMDKDAPAAAPSPGIHKLARSMSTASSRHRSRFGGRRG